jgi:hypothetical protein
MREVMYANGLSLTEVQRRLYSIDSLWAGQQDTRQRRTGLGTVAGRRLFFMSAVCRPAQLSVMNDPDAQRMRATHVKKPA